MNERSVKLISRVSLGPCSSGTRGGGTQSRKLSGRSAVGGGFGTSLWGRAATLPNWATIRRLPKRPAPGASRPWATSSASGGSTCDPCLYKTLPEPPEPDSPAPGHFLGWLPSPLPEPAPAPDLQICCPACGHVFPFCADGGLSDMDIALSVLEGTF